MEVYTNTNGGSHHHRNNYNWTSKQVTPQSIRKIKLYGSPTTKNLKKPHSSRRVGGGEMQRQVEMCGGAMWHSETAAAEGAVPAFTRGG